MERWRGGEVVEEEALLEEGGGSFVFIGSRESVTFHCAQLIHSCKDETRLHIAISQDQPVDVILTI